MSLEIRVCTQEDEEGIQNICYMTGFMGENLTGINIFNDRVLFGYLFCTYFVRYETDNCFVAVDDKGNIAGYILSTLDSKKQEKLFVLRMGWRIVLRTIFYTSWRYPESFKSVMYFIRHAKLDKMHSKILKEYPSHLHINILPEYQHSGTGSLLMAALEKHLENKGVKGIHLGTSNYNIKAIPFYNKKGFKVISQKKNELWKGIADYESIVFVKKLND